MSAHEIDDFEQIHLSQNGAVALRSVGLIPCLTRYDRTQSRATICDSDMSQSNEIIKHLPTRPSSKAPNRPTTKAEGGPVHRAAAVHKRSQLRHFATERNNWCAGLAPVSRARYSRSSPWSPASALVSLVSMYGAQIITQLRVSASDITSNDARS